MTTAIRTDEDLMIAAADGDREAFGEIVKRNMKKAYFAALRRVGDRDDALDLSQEAFVRAYRKSSTFDKGMPFFPWYYRILKNLCINHLRNRSRRAEGAHRFDTERILHKPRTPEEVFDRHEEKRLLWEALSRLPQDKREILMLREFEEMSYREIAHALGCPEGTVMSRLHAARKSLLEYYEKSPVLREVKDA